MSIEQIKAWIFPRVFKKQAKELLDAIAAEAEVQFLLSQAPLMDVPEGRDAYLRLSRMVIPFGYIHPRTFAEATIGRSDAYFHLSGYGLLPPSPTKWIFTSRLPLKRMILSPNPPPVVGK